MLSEIVFEKKYLGNQFEKVTIISPYTCLNEMDRVAQKKISQLFSTSFHICIMECAYVVGM